METITCAECSCETPSEEAYLEAHRWVQIAKGWADPLWFCSACSKKLANLERVKQRKEKYPVTPRRPWRT